MLKNHRFWYRSPRLLGEILAIVDDEGEVALPALVDEVLAESDSSEKTIRGAIGELASSGVLWLSMPPRARGDRMVRFTTLGAAWFHDLLGEVPGFADAGREGWDALEVLLEDGDVGDEGGPS